MTGADFDILGLALRLLDRAPPMDDPIGLGQDRGGRNWRSVVQSLEPSGPDRFRLLPVEIFKRPTGVRVVAIIADRTAERDNQPHRFGMHLGELARENPAQAPADDRNLAPGHAVDRQQPFLHLGNPRIVEPDIAAKLPAISVIAQIAQQAAQWNGRAIRREEPGQDQHWMAIASWQHRQQGARGIKGSKLKHRARFGQRQQPRGRTGLPCRLCLGSGHAFGPFGALADRDLGLATALAFGFASGLACALALGLAGALA